MRGRITTTEIEDRQKVEEDNGHAGEQLPEKEVGADLSSLSTDGVASVLSV